MDLNTDFCDLYSGLVLAKKKIAVVGLGYVGMPIAVAFAKKGLSVIGFDNNTAKIQLYKSGIDPTREVGNSEISLTNRNNLLDIRKCMYFISRINTFRAIPDFKISSTYKPRHFFQYWDTYLFRNPWINS